MTMMDEGCALAKGRHSVDEPPSPWVVKKKKHLQCKTQPLFSCRLRLMQEAGLSVPSFKRHIGTL